MEGYSWSGVTPGQAVEIQQKLRDRIVITDDFEKIDTVAGVDVSIGRDSTEGRCGIVVLSFPELIAVETRTYSAPVTFRYIPGLLAFREIPLFLDTYELLENKPDVLFFDGQGIAHPRKFGLACSGGLLVDKPAIGCAKSKLFGYYAELGEEAGSTSPLIAPDGERLGDVVRTKTGVKPIFVSPGHRVSVDTATRLALECVRGFRIPQPTRLAHELVSGKGSSRPSDSLL